MPELSYREGVRAALAESMRADEDVFLMGEDITEMGGSMGVTQGLFEEFGAERDPIIRLREKLEVTSEEWEAVEAEVHEIVEAAVEFAKNGTDPQPEDALKNVYA